MRLNRQTNRPTMLKVFVLFVSLSMLMSCAPGANEYGDFQEISPNGWAYNDTLTFHPSMTDSIATGSLMIALRHDNEYIYSNLWVEVSYEQQGRMVADSMNLELADAYGHWFGQGFGARYQLSDTVVPKIRLRNGSTIKIRHIMRDDTLKGIEQVGILFHQ